MQQTQKQIETQQFKYEQKCESAQNGNLRFWVLGIKISGISSFYKIKKLWNQQRNTEEINEETMKGRSLLLCLHTSSSLPRTPADSGM